MQKPTDVSDDDTFQKIQFWLPIWLTDHHCIFTYIRREERTKNWVDKNNNLFTEDYKIGYWIFNMLIYEERSKGYNTTNK